MYLEDVRKSVQLSKSLEVLQTQKWEYERKLQQIERCKQQYERRKLKTIISHDAQPNSTGVHSGMYSYGQTPKQSCEMLLAPTAQQIAKSIDKTIRDFESMQRSCLVGKHNKEQLEGDSCTLDTIYSPLQTITSATSKSVAGIVIEQLPNNCYPHHQHMKNDKVCNKVENMLKEDDDLPSLAPLELPSFDYSAFQSSGLIAIPPYSKV